MAKSIMIQGTTSGAGKSLITGGLCRIFRQMGLRAAPFKSQNMALNSYVTADGMEMGRAQVMQAQCAGIEPDVRMNPILLKPNSDTGSQVIVMGEVVGNMPAAEYFSYKKALIPTILEAYASLSREYDVIVLEGAGSPAEINLKQDDIVNMGLAKMVGAPVLLVGDIYPGGVFAALAGTIQLLTSEERDYVKGLVINKFRGDVEILRPGLSMLEDIVHKPVLGVIPFVDIDIDDEDSISDRLGAKGKGLVDIAVIRLPRLSNFTDFSPFAAMDEVGLRYVDNPGAFGNPDMVILPGTKNTMGDLKWLRETGMEATVLSHAGKGKPVIGICGGYQMMGRMLHDPEGLEFGGSMPGLGLLEQETVFNPEKTRTRVTGNICKIEGIFSNLSGMKFIGYEIHMGATKDLEEPAPFCAKSDGALDGAVSGNCYGCYIHGLFDSPNVAAGIVKALLADKGLSGKDVKAVQTRQYREEQFDLLADAIKASLDMDQIMRIVEKGVEAYGL